MDQLIIVIHVLLGLGIIGLIMMQQGRGADAGAGFGGGASGSVFGAQGSASFLSRMTAIFATLFFITSLGLAWLNSHRGGANPADIMMGEPSATENILPDPSQDKSGVPAINIPSADDQGSDTVSPEATTSPAQSAIVAPSPAVTEPVTGEVKKPSVESENSSSEQPNSVPNASADAHRADSEPAKSEATTAEREEKPASHEKRHPKKATKGHHRKD